MASPLPENVEDAYPLAPLQQGMLFHSISSPETAVYVEQISVTIDQPIFSVDAFKASWDLLIQRHNAFRTAFVWKNLKEPLQVVRRDVSLSWTEFDWRELDHTAQQSALAELKKQDRQTELLLNKAPLMRMTLVRLSDNLCEWIWTRHHLIADGWSTSHVLNELKQLYSGQMKKKPALLDPAPPYRNYIGWLKQKDNRSAETFWRNYLSGFTQRTRLDIEKARASTHRLGRFAEASSALDVEDFDALSTLCKTLRITPNTAIQAAWSLLLSRYSNSTDVVWGTTVSGRTAPLDGVEQTVGLFINTIPMRAEVKADQSVSEFLRGMQRNQIEAMAFEHTALRDIARWSEIPAGSPIFQSVVVYENYPSKLKDVENLQDPATLSFTNIEYKEQSDLPLALIAIPENGLSLILIYDQNVFDEVKIRRMLEQLRLVLSHLPSNVNTRLDQLPFLSETEIETVVHKWNDTQQDHQYDQFIDDLILDQARRQPSAPALVCGPQRTSYGELARQSQVFSEKFKSLHVASGDIVAICLPRGIDALIWMLAVLRSGAAYLMLDPEYPTSRLHEMLRRSRASTVVTDSRNGNRLNLSELLVLLEDGALANERPLAPRENTSRSFGDNAYVLFTSGSTGTPKGIAISHRNLVHSTAARSFFYGKAPVSFLLLSSFSFDSSVAGIYWTLTTGGKLVISEPRQEQNVSNLLRTISDEHVTHTLCLPGLYRAVLEHAKSSGTEKRLESLQVVINAGEAMPSGDHLETHRAVLPRAQLVNEYGPTEATVWCSAYDTFGHDSDFPVPIGRPIANTKLFILNSDGGLVPIGVSGELVIAGRNLADGYWQDPEATQKSFRRHAVIDESNTTVYHTGDLATYAEDGNVIYLGRLDEQVKIRGHRIEPREIESFISKFPGVASGAVTAINVNDQSPRLIAFLVPENDSLELTKLKDDLAHNFPAYMVPAQFTVIESLPLLENGKLDRQTLINLATSDATASRERSILRSPTNEVQRRLQKIWQEELGIFEIGIDENFFDLGGDSIISIRVVSRILQDDYNIGPNDIFEAPTIEQLSLRIEPQLTSHLFEAPSDSEQERKRIRDEYGDLARRAFPLTDSQAAFLFAYLSRGAADPGHMQVQAGIEGDLIVPLLEKCFSDVIARHESLRTVIRWKNKPTPEQVVFSQADAKISYEDLRQSETFNATTAYFQTDRETQLPIDQYPTWRIRVFQLEDRQHLLCWSLHHALIDGWSASIVLQEVMAAYQASLLGESPKLGDALQFFQYQHWWREQNKLPERSYWEELLAPLNQPREKVTTLDSAPRKKKNFQSVAITVSGSNLMTLEKRLKRDALTFAQALQISWALCLRAVGSRNPFAFFTTMSGRAAPIPGLDQLVGQLVNHLPIVITDRSGISDQIKAQSSLLRQMEHVSPSLIQSCCKAPIDSILDTDFGPLGVQSLVMMENFPWQRRPHIDHPNSCIFSSLQQRGQSPQESNSRAANNFPLTLVGIPDTGSFTMSLHFDSEIFDREKARQLVAHLERSLIDAHWDSDLEEHRGLATASRDFFNVHIGANHDAPLPSESGAVSNQIEQQISDIWQEILQRPVDSIDADFFELGGNSLSAVQIADSIETQLGVKMPLAVLIEHSTVRKLASALQDSSQSFNVVVPIQPQGEQTPLFGIHAEGNVLFYRDFSKRLGERQPFFGIQSPQLAGEGDHFASIKEMASRYVQEIKKVWPSGPYNLCGMCIGGLIAFEVAQQLEHGGDKVDALIVFDTGAPQLDRKVSKDPSSANPSVTRARVWPFLVKIFKHLKAGRLPALTRHYFSTVPVVYKLLQKFNKSNHAPSAQERIAQVRLNQAFVTRRYKAGVHSGKITLIYSEEFKNLGSQKDMLTRWGAACGGRLTSFLVPGRHGKMLEPPHVDSVANIVETILGTDTPRNPSN